MASTVIPGQGVFGPGIVAGIACMTAPIPRLVAMEVIEALRPAFRQWSSVAVMWVIAIVDVAIEAVVAVEPRASTDEHPANEPIGPVVAIRCAVIRRIVKVSVRAHGRWSNVYAHRDLGVGCRCTREKSNSKCYENKRVDFVHDFSLIILDW